MTFHELTICLDLQPGYCSDLENRDMPDCSEQVFCTDTELALRVLAWREGQAGSESACNQGRVCFRERSLASANFPCYA